MELPLGLDPLQVELATVYYVTVVMGGLRILILQDQIYTLEPIIDMTSSNGESVGQIPIDDKYWPVYCLSEGLTPLQYVPDTRRICMLLNIQSGLFGLLCDQVILTEWADEVEILPVPECMRTPNTWLQGLVIREDEVLCVASAEDLLACCEVSL